MRLGARFLLLFLPLAVQAQDFKKQVIYQIVTDRFNDGDLTNDNPTKSQNLYDPTHKNWQAYWGGDFAGIEQKLAYIRGMGATAVWASPLVDNENLPCNSAGVFAPYHSYWTRDFMRIEEHFGDQANSFRALDSLISALHARGMKMIVDQANNHSNPDNCGEMGSLYRNGSLMASAGDDPKGYFHHNAGIADYNDRYQVQYNTLADLADLNQENADIDAYLKAAALQLQSHSVDAFRLDAVKHVTWGWEYSFANAVLSNAPSFLFGEWIHGGKGDPLYEDARKFANRSGISLLDFPLNNALRNVFGADKSFREVDAVMQQENEDFSDPNDLVIFFDSHHDRVDEALAFLLTARGIPVILYGDEQYLFEPTNNGNDPYDRVWMSSYNTKTTAYKVIRKLSALRQTNDALAYGSWKQRWMNDDAYIYEREFFGSVVLVAMNKSETGAVPVSGLFTSLPAGDYADVLGGQLGGKRLTVTPGEVAAHPEAGSIGPHVGQAGVQITMAGDGFGSTPGSVLFGATAAPILSWSNTSVTFKAPEVKPGHYDVQLRANSGTSANTMPFTLLTAKLIPVTFTVHNAVATDPGDYIFLTGNSVELGNWGTTFQTAVGPMLDPHYPDWFLNVSLPAGQTLEYKFIKVRPDGSVVWEGGANHTLVVPGAGTGSVDSNWQP
jgi:glycosidase